MFYYLLYNSSFSFIVESRLFSTILYGSILYILTHAVLNYCDISILNIINNYYWTLFTLDIISCIYSLYQSFINGNNITNDITNDITNNNGQNNLNVSFNLLKNKINTMLDRKNDLTITQIPIQQQTNPNLQSNQNNNNTQSNQNYNNTQNHIPINKNKFSTPISQLQNIKQGVSINSTNKSSTPINLIRNNINIVEPYIDDKNDINDINIQDTQGNQGNQGNQSNQYGESVAGSDVGNIMDLSDFETTL